MSGRAYGMLYPTPSPSAEIECRWRAVPALPRSPRRSIAHAPANAARVVPVGPSAGGTTAANAGRLPPAR